MNYNELSKKIERHYASHGASVKLTACDSNSYDDRFVYDVKIKKGTKEAVIFNRANDIKIALGLPLFQPFKEGLSIRLVVSCRPVTENSLHKMLTSAEFHRSKMPIPIALGYNMRGNMHFFDLTSGPHSMYGGATNSGKTVGLQSLILSIAVKQSVNRVNLLIIDTGANGLDMFNALPHLSHPIVKDEETAVMILRQLNDEMERRSTLPKEELRQLPALICTVDEYIALIKNISGTGKAMLKSALENLLRKGRHSKIHMVLATQEPAKQDMLINLNNINARMAFTCSDFYSSRSILGEGGAEKLSGNGALLFTSPAHTTPLPLQGAFMATEEMRKLIGHVLSKPHDCSNMFVMPEVDLSSALATGSRDFVSDANKELASVIMWALNREKVSDIQVRENFNMGNRASEIVEVLFDMGIVSAKFSKQPRTVIPTSFEDLPLKTIEFLEQNGYGEEAIRKAFNPKCDTDSALERVSPGDTESDLKNGIVDTIATN